MGSLNRLAILIIAVSDLLTAHKDALAENFSYEIASKTRPWVEIQVSAKSMGRCAVAACLSALHPMN